MTSLTQQPDSDATLRSFLADCIECETLDGMAMRAKLEAKRLGIGVVQFHGRAPDDGSEELGLRRFITAVRGDGYDPQAIFDLAIDEALRLGLAQVRGRQVPQAVP